MYDETEYEMNGGRYCNKKIRDEQYIDINILDY